jgi:hypothetical protein
MKTVKNVRIIGLLFILPLVSYGFGNSVIESVTENQDPFHVLGHSRYQLMTGSLLVVVNSVIVILLGIRLFPWLETDNRTTALTYLICRVCEGLLLLVGLIAVLACINETTGFLRFATGIRLYSYQFAMIALGLGSIGFCRSLYRQKLVPAFLAVWGLIGYLLLTAGAILELYDLPVSVLFSVPGGLFELTIGIFLLTKGFSQTDRIG